MVMESSVLSVSVLAIAETLLPSLPLEATHAHCTLVSHWHPRWISKSLSFQLSCSLNSNQCTIPWKEMTQCSFRFIEQFSCVADDGRVWKDTCYTGWIEKMSWVTNESTVNTAIIGIEELHPLWVVRETVLLHSTVIVDDHDITELLDMRPSHFSKYGR